MTSYQWMEIYYQHMGLKHTERMTPTAFEPIWQEFYLHENKLSDGLRIVAYLCGLPNGALDGTVPGNSRYNSRQAILLKWEVFI